jgi:hypothetical protein
MSNMESNMQILGPVNESTGLIYQITDTIEGIDVVIDFCYSGNDEENTVDFEYASAESGSNPVLSEEQLEMINKVLECGQEERYVVALANYYALNADFKFVTEYAHNPTSILYQK